ncbi:high-affinity branched-chain amino acid transport system permease protein LivH [Oxobacter pfennigii]|uniref:High-affinity branched-chain amino acid transport system permease protein LivH n=2 Tax=Oxobacter pfennigii TaxID=36849 RepID=A0A0P8YWH4_9CLOT|nr:high-affinity branched-chain amino acid transport system permease protein LivH [Oxobacter pfennigii]
MVFLQQTINGIALGSVYALIALGYTMVYGIVQLINFAHGDIYMVGAYAAFFAAGALKLPFLPVLLIAMATSAILGLTIEKLAYRPIRTAPKVTNLITAIGVSLLIENLVRIFIGPNPRSFPELIKVQIINIGSLQINNLQIVVFSVSVILMLILQFIVHKTKVGKAMRAVSQDKDAAKLMGINIDRTISYTFAIGSSLAAVAGVLVGIVYQRIDPLMGVMSGLKAFIAAVLGGIGIIPGAMAGGFLMGIAETLTKGYISTQLSDAIAFAILIIILLVKPSGLMGKKTSEKV